MNPFLSDKSWTTHLVVSEATVSTYDDDYVAYMEHTLADGDVEYHHGLYWRRDPVLEEPLYKMPKMHS
jgi:hypothetical protein